MNTGDYIQYLLALVFVLALIGLIAVAARRFGVAGVAGGRRGARIAVLETAAVDKRRRLLLIRRDGVEHLVMIGGSQDFVIESNIQHDAMRRPELGTPRHPSEPDWTERDAPPVLREPPSRRPRQTDQSLAAPAAVEPQFEAPPGEARQAPARTPEPAVERLPAEPAAQVQPTPQQPAPQQRRVEKPDASRGSAQPPAGARRPAAQPARPDAHQAAPQAAPRARVQEPRGQEQRPHPDQVDRDDPRHAGSTAEMAPAPAAAQPQQQPRVQRAAQTPQPRRPAPAPETGHQPARQGSPQPRPRGTAEPQDRAAAAAVQRGEPAMRQQPQRPVTQQRRAPPPQPRVPLVDDNDAMLLEEPVMRPKKSVAGGSQDGS